MEYTEFVEQIRHEIELKMGPGVRVRINQILKNNRMPMDGLAILRDGENAAPAVYLETYFQKYQSGMGMDEILDQIQEFYSRNRITGRINMDFFADFENVKDRIVCRLVNQKKNKCLLEHVPSRSFMDLAIVFYFVLEEPKFGNASVQIQKSHLDAWGITEEELFEAAKKNETTMMQHELLNISDMIRELTGVGVDESGMESVPMYVLSNQERNYGAVSIIFPHVLEAVAEQVNGDYYILPSSIHECMIVPVRDGLRMSAAELRAMVCEINREHVAEDEILGDSVYRYFALEKDLHIAANEDTAMSDLRKYTDPLL